MSGSTLAESPTEPSTDVGEANPPDSQLGGSWRVAARTGWVVVTLLVLALNAVMLPRYFAVLQAPCLPGQFCFAIKVGPYDQQLMRQWHLSLGFLAGYQVMLDAVSVVAYCALGALLVWRKSADRMALFCAYMLVLFGGTSFTSILQDTLMAQTPAWHAFIGALDLLGQCGFLIFFLLFPSGRFVPRWSVWVIPLIVAYWVRGIFLPDVFQGPYEALDGVTFIFLLLFMVGVQVYRYRAVSTARERQQTKWVVFGLAFGILGFVLLIVAGNFLVPATLAQSSVIGTFVEGTGTYGFLLLVPLSIVIAILRSGLFDIDTIINRALVYGALTALLAAVYFGCVVAVQALGQALTGDRSLPPIAVVISTLLIAALFTPARRRLQAFIDRRFYRRKYDAARTLAAFSATLRGEVNMGQLSEHLVAVVHETMQPTHISLWLNAAQTSHDVGPNRASGRASGQVSGRA